MNLDSPKNIDPHAAHLTENETISGAWTFTSPLLVPVGSTAIPGLAFVGSPTTGISRAGANLSMSVSHNGVNVIEFQSGVIGTNVPIGSNNSGRPAMMNTPITATVPGFTIRGDFDTGIGYPGADQLNMIAGGEESLRIDKNAVSGNTRLLVYDVDNGTTERVSVGAPDSGGTGYKVLRIPN
jgi:hypothetical protein